VAEPCTSSNTSPQLNSCFALLRCPASVPHEPTPPTSTCLPAPARTESLCRISLQRHWRPALHPLSAASSRSLPPQTLPAIRIRTTHHRPPIPAASAQHHSNPIATQLPAASFKSLYPKRPHNASIKPTGEMGAPDTALGLSGSANLRFNLKLRGLISKVPHITTDNFEPIHATVASVWTSLETRR
jgi:hypothetical protein